MFSLKNLARKGLIYGPTYMSDLNMVIIVSVDLPAPVGQLALAVTWLHRQTWFSLFWAIFLLQMPSSLFTINNVFIQFMR